MRCVTGISSPHTILINEMPHRLKNLCQDVGCIKSESDTDTTSRTSSESAKVFGFGVSSGSSNRDDSGPEIKQYDSAENVPGRRGDCTPMMEY